MGFRIIKKVGKSIEMSDTDSGESRFLGTSSLEGEWNAYQSWKNTNAAGAYQQRFSANTASQIFQDGVSTRSQTKFIPVTESVDPTYGDIGGMSNAGGSLSALLTPADPAKGPGQGGGTGDIPIEPSVPASPPVEQPTPQQAAAINQIVQGNLDPTTVANTTPSVIDPAIPNTGPSLTELLGVGEGTGINKIVSEIGSGLQKGAEKLEEKIDQWETTNQWSNGWSIGAWRLDSDKNRWGHVYVGGEGDKTYLDGDVRFKIEDGVINTYVYMDGNNPLSQGVAGWRVNNNHPLWVSEITKGGKSYLVRTSNRPTEPTITSDPGTSFPGAQLGTGDTDAPAVNDQGLSPFTASSYSSVPWSPIYKDWVNDTAGGNWSLRQFMNEQGLSNDPLRRTAYTQFLLQATEDDPHGGQLEGSSVIGSLPTGGIIYGGIKDLQPTDNLYRHFLDGYVPLQGEALTGKIQEVINVLREPESSWDDFQSGSTYSDQELRNYRWRDNYGYGSRAAQNQQALAALPIMQNTPVLMREQTSRILSTMHDRWQADPNKPSDEGWLEFVHRNNYFGLIGE